MTVLPTELVETIIDRLADSKSKQDLRSCSLVCKRWLPRSRTWIFRSISACPKSPIIDLKSFLDAIHNVQSSPHLSSLVREIKVDCCHVPELTRITFNTLNLEHLSRLWLCRHDFARFELNLISLTRTLTSSLDTLIINRTVFRDACQLLHFLSSPCFSRLRSLSLTDISYMMRSDTNSRDVAWIMGSWTRTASLRLPILHKIMLEEFKIGLIPDHNIFDLLFHSNSPFDWTCLRRITFSRIWDNVLIQGFLNGPLPALSSVEFEKSEKMYHFTSSGAFTGTIENPSVLLNLSELSIGFDLSDEDFHFLNEVIRSLGSGKRQSKPKIVTIVLPPMGLPPSKQMLEVAALFLKLACLSSIQRLRLIVQFSTGWSDQKKTDCKDFYGYYLLSSTNPKVSLVFKEGQMDQE
ncbi:hypothetical protein BT96DRAFT_920477 [Gymnopus androsaceus JB14]|uniref:F-box domain-containing protein n=1 Tax=Gymnopus androsaceus JB14 TaxID=1447944 RepID=A0A6A4HN83_9AGAR|nr:hypothetical protein BT96DRAFT_920477 [Gymnopus androsaceus JB14]